jgi:hypothetical protein
MLRLWLLQSMAGGCACRTTEQADADLQRWAGEGGAFIGSFDDSDKLCVLRCYVVRPPRAYMLVTSVLSSDLTSFRRSTAGFIRWCNKVGVETVWVPSASWETPRSGKWQDTPFAKMFKNVRVELFNDSRYYVWTVAEQVTRV